MNRTTFFTVLFRASRPLSLAAGVLLYALGGGIANYLGHTIDWSIYWLGQGVVTTLQLGSYFLREYFDLANRPPFKQEPSANEILIGPSRVAYLQLAATCLTAGAVLTVLLVGRNALSISAMVILAIAFLLALSYSIPPLRLVYSGYGELVLSILQANLFPALAFLLQSGELHRLLALLTFPLTFLFLSVLLALSLNRYFDDIRQERHTMMARLGWQRGMTLHNLLIALTYLLVAVAFVVFNLPWRLAFPAFLSLPVGIFQIWQMNRIAGGAKPRWRLLYVTAIATLACTVYFLNLALWTG